MVSLLGIECKDSNEVSLLRDPLPFKDDGKESRKESSGRQKD
jgi:hypothetical protein